jgi:hypothetical protein
MAIKSSYTVIELYDDFVKYFSDKRRKYSSEAKTIDKKKFKAVIEDINRLLIEERGAKNIPIVIPFNLGKYCLIKRKLGLAFSKTLNEYVPRQNSKATKENIAKLEKEGVIVKSKENPNGVDPTIYFTKQYFVNWHYSFHRANFTSRRTGKTVNPPIVENTLYYNLKLSKLCKELKVKVNKLTSDEINEQFQSKNVFKQTANRKAF